MNKKDFTEFKELFKKQTGLKKIVFIPIVIGVTLWCVPSFIIYCVMWLVSFLCIGSSYVRQEITDNIKNTF